MFYDVSERTLRNWAKRLALEAEGKRVRGQGRPRIRRDILAKALGKLRRAWSVMTKGMANLDRAPGARTLAKAAKTSRYLAERFVENRKEKNRRKRDREARKRRSGFQVLQGGVVTTLDGKHIGRRQRGRIEMQVLRDRCDLFIEGVFIGTRMDAETIARKVEAYLRANPWVLAIQTDFAPVFRSRIFQRMLRRNLVVWYPSLPHTPQHNPLAEQGMGEQDGFFPSEGVSSVEEGDLIASRAMLTLNTGRPRPSRGGLTSQALRGLRGVEIPRFFFYREYLMIKRGLRREAGPGVRAKRKANRRAAEETLIKFRLARRVLGTALQTAVGAGKD